MLLPDHYRSLPWIQLEIDGEATTAFWRRVNRRFIEPDAWEEPAEPLSEHPLLLLVRRLLEGQPRWAFILAVDDDGVSRRAEKTLDQLISWIIDAYSRDSKEPPGFICYAGRQYDAPAPELASHPPTCTERCNLQLDSRKPKAES